MYLLIEQPATEQPPKNASAIWAQAAKAAHKSATRHFADALVATDRAYAQALLWLAADASARAARFEELAEKFQPKATA